MVQFLKCHALTLLSQCGIWQSFFVKSFANNIFWDDGRIFSNEKLRKKIANFCPSFLNEYTTVEDLLCFNKDKLDKFGR